MDSSTLVMVRAGDHWFFKISKQMPPEHQQTQHHPNIPKPLQVQQRQARNTVRIDVTVVHSGAKCDLSVQSLSEKEPMTVGHKHKMQVPLED